MKNAIDPSNPATDMQNTISNDVFAESSSINRRKFVEYVAASALTFTIVPRHVLGGKNYTAPSDQITLAYIGIGTQGIRELLPLLANTQFRVIAVCDPNKEAIGYKDWGKEWL
ncbi:MAG TPA: gfo/Idh/MocA family oxidoreductase, partial [Puia sp.]